MQRREFLKCIVGAAVMPSAALADIKPYEEMWNVTAIVADGGYPVLDIPLIASQADLDQMRDYCSQKAIYPLSYVFNDSASWCVDCRISGMRDISEGNQKAMRIVFDMCGRPIYTESSASSRQVNPNHTGQRGAFALTGPGLL